MNWDAIGAIGEIIGAAAVFASLLYLAIQVRHSNKQTELEAYRHTWDSLNELIDSLTSSVETASIINRGRASLDSLNPDEKLIFEYLHVKVLNAIESWHHQVTETSKPGPYFDNQIGNICGVIDWFFRYPGSKEVWKGVRHMFVPIQEIVEQNIE